MKIEQIPILDDDFDFFSHRPVTERSREISEHRFLAEFVGETSKTDSVTVR
jgi:hypothetical protein